MNTRLNRQAIPRIVLIGMNHKTASIELREKFSINDNDLSTFLSKARNFNIEEIVYVTTCNRTEIYFTSYDVKESVNQMLSLLEEYSNLERKSFDKNIYKKYSREAISHLFCVTSSLDSMVIGENEILNQVKKSYDQSNKLKNTGIILNRLFHQSFNTAKKVRTETEISKNPLSIAFIAVELAKQIFDDISQKKALLIGAGEMGELILKSFVKNKISDITIANRSLQNAEKIAREIYKGSHIIPLDDIQNTASSVDIIISSVTSKKYIITKEVVEEVIKNRGKNPLFLIDIAVPRNIDPEISKMDNIFLYNVDDLESIADENLKNRLNEVKLASQLIELDTDCFLKWYEELTIVPTIVKIQDKFESIREKELNKYKKRKLKHLSDEDFKIIEQLTRQLMKKYLHNPINRLKSYQESGDSAYSGCMSLGEKLKIIEEIFDEKNK